MHIVFQFEAQLRQVAGTGERAVEITDDASVRGALQEVVSADETELRERILAADGGIQPSVLVFVNDAAVPAGEANDLKLKDGDRVLLLPPISGG